MSSFLVGITGASGSGKTTLLHELCASFRPEDICLISQDNYYLPRELQTPDENGILNFDLPQSIDLEAYYRDIRQLKSGQPVLREEYTFNNPDTSPKVLEFIPAPIVIVEGLFVFYHEKLRSLVDLRVFVEVDDHLRVIRRIMRDSQERGYGIEDVLYRYEHHVYPAYQQFILPHRREADIIIPNNHHFARGLQVLAAFLKTQLPHSEAQDPTKKG